MDTVDTLRQLGSEHYRILLTAVPPKPSRESPFGKLAWQ
jgi:hypothetical protein